MIVTLIKSLKNFLPSNFNSTWVKSNSIKYNIIQKEDIIYDYVFYFVLFFIFLLYFFNKTLYECVVLFQVLSYYDYYKLKKYLFNMLVGVIFGLNILYLLLNKTRVSKIKNFLKNLINSEEKKTLEILQSYYSLCFFFNIQTCLFMFVSYIQMYIHSNVYFLIYL